MPISSLISLKYWIVGGVSNPVHPSGLIISSMALATGLLLKRGFCSWICPLGLLTEYLNRLHTLIFRKDIKLPPWLDYPLRSLKYLLLGFFLFIGGSVAGRIAGYWQTSLSNNEYLFHVRNLDMPFYQHNRGEAPPYDREAWLRMMKKITLYHY